MTIIKFLSKKNFNYYLSSNEKKEVEK